CVISGSFAASTSSFSITGGWAKSSEDLSFKALAISPERCASRPLLSGNVSKIPKVEGPKRIAYHVVVLGSFSTIDRPLRRNFSTSISLPLFASSRTNNATLVIVTSFGYLRKLIQKEYLHNNYSIAP